MANLTEQGDMTNATCSVDGCLKKVKSAGLCSMHYERRRRERIAAGLHDPKGNPCKGCGARIERTGSRGHVSHYCSDDCRPRCSVDGCNSSQKSRGWCEFHYTRWKLTGDPAAPLTVTRYGSDVCAFEGCSGARRNLTWCKLHYGQWRRTGRVWEIKSWNEPQPCMVCGDPPARGFRRFCSAACARLWRHYGGNVPESTPCIRCGKEMSLWREGGERRRRNPALKICRRCRQDIRKHGMSVEQLARRDGTDCGICRKPVDMSLRAPDMMRASVDHILPKARGGTNDPANLQLAHLLCNALKKDRVMP